MNKNLVWQELERRTVFNARVFDIVETRSLRPGAAAEGEAATGRFTVIESHDWAIVIPVLERAGGRHFVMVRQWRHGAGEESLEFPGGVVEAGELDEAGARRELREETGYTAGKITKLGIMSPNPAIMNNRVHFFCAEDLRLDGAQNLDADEYVAVELKPVAEVLREMGQPPYIHALMAAALLFYTTRIPPS